MSPAERWLREHLAEAPPALLAEMVAALASSGQDAEESVPDALAAAALHLYARLLDAGRGDRRDALPLLAADALLTHALEAQAGEDPAGLAAFTERWGGAGRLGELAMKLPAA